MRCIVLWIPAYAGMTVGDAGNDGRPPLPLWIADQVRNDGLSCPAAFHGAVSPPCGYCLEASMTDLAVGVGLVSPSAPVSGTGTGFGPLPSREEGIL